MEKKQRITYEKATGTLRRNIVSTYLPVKYLEHFHSLWLKSRRESKELTGEIKIKAVRRPHTLEIRYDLVSVKKNNAATNMSVAPQIGTFVYHTHPGSIYLPTNAFLLPSDSDMIVYTEQYPRLQFNIVADSHGIYIVTLNPSMSRTANRNRLITTWHDIVYTRLSPFLHTSGRMAYHIFPNNDIKPIINSINQLMNPLGLDIRYVPYGNTSRIPVKFLSTRPILNLPIVNSINTNNNYRTNMNINKSNLNINNSIRSLINRNRKIVSAVTEYRYPMTNKTNKKMVQNAYTNFKTTRIRNKKSILSFQSFMNKINSLSKE